jgi:NADPH2:quinone reductase
MLKPEKLSFEEAAAIPETWFTAYQALFFVAGLKKGQDVLIHAGASGVGIAAIQLSKEAGA